ncbi:BRO family protein [Pelomonas sp. UHG3]|uniref:BRO family protein n=1 Tax=Roseateles hydrophilus TaxID=2975054 RepID=A0ACC6CDM1_9BURK|nr:BRO family protein [Pelomonas sp. UHG3]MCY4746444.1 BRO family protein [Pelomonas sp. UHG3]
MDRDGAPWFIAKDLLLALDIGGSLSAGPSPYLKHLGDHEKGLVAVLTPRGGEQRVLAVNESGFYKLVLKSRKPEARKFQDWVTGVVLPSIRKDGGYILGRIGMPDRDLTAAGPAGGRPNPDLS